MAQQHHSPFQSPQQPLQQQQQQLPFHVLVQQQTPLTRQYSHFTDPFESAFYQSHAVQTSASNPLPSPFQRPLTPQRSVSSPFTSQHLPQAHLGPTSTVPFSLFEGQHPYREHGQGHQEQVQVHELTQRLQITSPPLAASSHLGIDTSSENQPQKPQAPKEAQAVEQTFPVNLSCLNASGADSSPQLTKTVMRWLDRFMQKKMNQQGLQLSTVIHCEPPRLQVTGSRHAVLCCPVVLERFLDNLNTVSMDYIVHPEVPVQAHGAVQQYMLQRISALCEMAPRSAFTHLRVQKAAPPNLIKVIVTYATPLSSDKPPPLVEELQAAITRANQDLVVSLHPWTISHITPAELELPTGKGDPAFPIQASVQSTARNHLETVVQMIGLQRDILEEVEKREKAIRSQVSDVSSANVEAGPAALLLALSPTCRNEFCHEVKACVKEHATVTLERISLQPAGEEAGGDVAADAPSLEATTSPNRSPSFRVLVTSQNGLTTKSIKTYKQFIMHWSKSIKVVSVPVLTARATTYTTPPDAEENGHSHISSRGTDVLDQQHGSFVLLTPEELAHHDPDGTCNPIQLQDVVEKAETTVANVIDQMGAEDGGDGEDGEEGAAPQMQEMLLVGAQGQCHSRAKALMSALH
eukprot:m.258585 g.258585  ORF g.258585 m.258585 type:complete len:636 (+) comp15543_c0_seq1:197-2104(+)